LAGLRVSLPTKNLYPRIAQNTILVWLLLLMLFPSSAHAQTGLLNRRSAEFFSHDGNTAFLTLGLVLPLLRDGERGPSRSLRTLDTLATNALLTQGLKYLFREKRPDGSGERNSFPSGHASAAFAIAAMQSNYRPKEAPLWFLGAFLIADSRVTLNRHRPRDVVAGAFLGVGVAAWERSEPRGILIAPFVRPRWDKDDRGIEIGFGGVF
jgi:membrane-associated phospholipid phosphatase